MISTQSGASLYANAKSECPRLGSNVKFLKVLKVKNYFLFFNANFKTTNYNNFISTKKKKFLTAKQKYNTVFKHYNTYLLKINKLLN